MAKIYIGNNSYKLMLGNTKIRRGYLGSTLVYSGDINVTYHITNDIIYEEAVEEGLSCLQPKSFDPNLARSGYERCFLGWRLDRESSPDVIDELIAGSDNIDLYAVYYKEFTVNFYNGSTKPYTYKYRAYINNETPLVYPTTGTEETTVNKISGYTNTLGWTDIVWSDQTKNFVQKYKSASKITIKQNLNLYSVYNTNITLTIINGKLNDVDKKYVSGVRSRQYTTTVNTFNPLVTLKHNEVSGWDNAGWSIDGAETKSLDDGNNILISSSFDNVEYISALYTKDINMYVVNSDNKKVTNPAKILRIYKSNEIKTNRAMLTLSHNELPGWNNYGWSTEKDSVVQFYNSDGYFSVDDTYADMTFYALYRKTIKFNVYNIKNNKTTYNRYITIQYNTDPVRHKEADHITLNHDTIQGYSNYGWNTNKYDVQKEFDDGDREVTEKLDNQNIYPLYFKNTSVNVINGDLKSVKHTGIRKLQFNGGPYDPNPSGRDAYIVDPEVVLKHISYGEPGSQVGRDWLNNGWNFGADNQNSLFYDSTLIIPETYDGKTIYALYKRKVTLTGISNGTYNESAYQYHRAITGEWRSNYPSIKLKKPADYYPETGWHAAGWTKNSTGTSPEYANTANVTLYDNMVVYGIYKRNVTLTSHNGGALTSETKTRYYNVYAELDQNPVFTVNDPAAQTGKTFLGWSISSSSITVKYKHFKNVSLDQDTHIYAVWKVSDVVVADYTKESAGFKTYYANTGDPWSWRIYEIPVKYKGKDIDYSLFESISVDTKVYAMVGLWQSGVWAIWGIFAGTRPKNNGSYDDQQYELLRKVHSTNGVMDGDEGPCSDPTMWEGGSTRATVTAKLVPTTGYKNTSVVSIVLYGMWYNHSDNQGYSRAEIYKITLKGRTIVG